MPFHGTPAILLIQVYMGIMGYMNIQENVPLGDYSTMRLGGTAAYLTDINKRDELAEAVAWAEERQLPIILIGSGSNIIWTDEGFPGLVLVNKLAGFEIYDMDADNVYVTVGGGENWDSVVERTVTANLSGIEQLSLIPGTAGATPVQNVGAYGREIADVLTTLEAYDTKEKKFITMRASDCGFSYRDSRFKGTDKGRFLISSITLQLSHQPPMPPFYESLQRYLTEHQVKEHTPHTIRQAVIAIRTSKLPDPAVVANTGSFFANPIIPAEQLRELHGEYPSMPFWTMPGGKVKVPGGWLIEQCGLKDVHDDETGMATWKDQALVLVNEQAKSTADLLKFKQKIVGAVHAKFGITLVQEPEMI